MSEIIDKLKQNIETERAMFREISNYNLKSATANANERELYENAISSLRKQIKLINNSIPAILNNVSLAKELPSAAPKKAKATGLEEINYIGENRGIKVALGKKDREKFLKELSISEGAVKMLKKHKSMEAVKKPQEFQTSRGYLKIANKYFLGRATGLVKKGYFTSLGNDLRKGNFEVLLETYVAMMLFTSVLAIPIGFILTIFFMFFSFGFASPFISLYSGSYLLRFIEVIWLLPLAPLATFLAVYIYPSTERSSLSKRIDQEIPFAVIHMSAISGSGIPPVEIFKIIGLSPEYPYLGKEIVKVLNQINLYGYDLGTALTNAAKTAPNQRLAELFSGLVTTINSGGDLTEFFDKRAETLMVQYRLERESFAKMAETFMDIYISVVIATPMILMLLLMMISITGTNIGFGPTEIGLIIVGVIALINIFFLFFLNIKQPTY